MPQPQKLNSHIHPEKNMVIISTLSSKIYYMQLSTKGRKRIAFSMLVRLEPSWSIKCQ